jgi:hypothetical protein
MRYPVEYQDNVYEYPSWTSELKAKYEKTSLTNPINLLAKI